MKFLISAGEASGDMHGAALLAALQRRVPDLDSSGVGGERMRAAGCELIVEAREVAVVGLAEVVSHLPRIWSRFRRLLAAVDRRRPDAAILIDFPDFNLRLAKQLHRRGIPVIYYISPQLWAWRTGRLKQIRRYVRKMLVIFPFEEDWYRARGVDAEYVGHPLVDARPQPSPRSEFAAGHGLDVSKQWIALLPGSRRKEVGLNLPAMLRAAGMMGDAYQFVLPVASTLEPSWMAQQVRGSRASVVLSDDALTTVTHARAAVVASGTATVEAALAGTPFVVVYRVSPLTWALGRPLVRVPHIAMVNLIAAGGPEGDARKEARVVPELVQGDFTAEAVARELRRILPDGPERQKMLDGLAEVREKLRGTGAPASERAAEAVLRALERQTAPARV